MGPLPAGGIDALGGQPIDEEWLARMTRLLARLKNLRWRYQEGTSGRGRSKMGMLNATGCTSVWGSTFPFNPYPFPWANHLFQDAPSVAMGVFEGHARQMGEGFKALRIAELELAASTPRRSTTASSNSSTGSSSTTTSCACCRRSRCWAATGPCSTSASRTCRGP